MLYIEVAGKKYSVNQPQFHTPYTKCSTIKKGLEYYSDLLQDGRSRDRIPMGAELSTPVQTGPGAHSASCTMVTGSLSRGVKLLGHRVNHPPPSSDI